VALEVGEVLEVVVLIAISVEIFMLLHHERMSHKLD